MYCQGNKIITWMARLSMVIILILDITLLSISMPNMILAMGQNPLHTLKAFLQISKEYYIDVNSEKIFHT